MKSYNRKKLNRPTDNRADFLPTPEELEIEYLEKMEELDREISESAKRIFSSPEYLEANFSDPLDTSEIFGIPFLTPTGLTIE